MKKEKLSKLDLFTQFVAHFAVFWFLIVISLNIFTKIDPRLPSVPLAAIFAGIVIFIRYAPEQK